MKFSDRYQLCHNQRCTITVLMCSFTLRTHAQKADILLVTSTIHQEKDYSFTTGTTKQVAKCTHENTTQF